MEVLLLRCARCGAARLSEDRLRAIAPLVVARRRPVPVWQGVALLVVGAGLAAARRWAVRRTVRALLPLLLTRVLPDGGGDRAARGVRVTELTVTLRQRVEER
ncbi:MAG: hypothetical protein HYU88_04180 [Chloroflexi bacterium]|nr:hypothetical protein [Chloroflexota bacterium]